MCTRHKLSLPDATVVTAMLWSFATHIRAHISLQRGGVPSKMKPPRSVFRRTVLRRDVAMPSFYVSEYAQSADAANAMASLLWRSRKQSGQHVLVAGRLVRSDLLPYTESGLLQRRSSESANKQGTYGPKPSTADTGID